MSLELKPTCRRYWQLPGGGKISSEAQRVSSPTLCTLMTCKWWQTTATKRWRSMK